ncbi:triose-phosphate transporter family-domain-containing protein [Lipomyces japonicus]|uniref:triose-phosphate transporter family-domain-containing protein n=1 Tax=Lipomyces japonicus TaxID=56871 RepID=UPI0034CFCB5C
MPERSVLPIHSSSDSQLQQPQDSLRTKYQWLAVYFFFNLGLTIYNKAVLGNFPFPYVLTGIHALCGSIGCLYFYVRGTFTLTPLSDRENVTLFLFSLLYTINIAISNVSLNLVTVPFHQIVRATTPFFTVLIYVIGFRKVYSPLTYVSLIPVVAGVGFATAGDYYFTAIGFFLTLLGAFLAALKTVVTNRVQTGRLRLSPLELLFRMSPLAFVQTLVYAYFTGELASLNTYWHDSMTSAMFFKLVLNGAIAFGLNVVSFTANKKTGALTMTVAANVKQILTIVLAILFFHLDVTPLNAFGIVLTLAGGAWYAKVELESKQRNSAVSAQAIARKDESIIKA